MADREETPEMKMYLRNWVEINVNDLIQVPDNNFGHRRKLRKIIGLFWGHIHVEGNGCQVTHSNLKGNKTFM